MEKQRVKKDIPISITTACIFFLVIITAAHFYRGSEYGLVFVTLISPFLLIYSKKWHRMVFQYLILLNTIEWLKTFIKIISLRIINNESFLRTGIIMILVILLNTISLFLIKNQKNLKKIKENSTYSFPPFFAFIVITLLLAIPYKKLDTLQPIILERILPRSGWIEIFFLGIYGANITEKLLSSENVSILRKKIWFSFTLIFFGQLILGLSGFPQFLMSNKIHLPIPGILIAGPIFRGKISLFMPLLLMISLLFVGPAWCSYLCYFGSIDLIASQSKKETGKIKLKTTIISRIIIISLLVIIPLLLRIAKINTFIASIIGIIYGIVGIIIIVKISKKQGLMLHCTSYCPIGLINTIIGKINPFRIKISANCIKCNKCINVCKYGALSISSLTKGTPDLRCTLCGDCISSCKGNHIRYSFFSLHNDVARRIFITTVIIFHTLFLGLGRV